MAHPHLKTLENQAAAAGSAFGFLETDFDARPLPAAHPGRIALALVALGGVATAVAHYLGWTSLVARLGGWGQAA